MKAFLSIVLVLFAGIGCKPIGGTHKSPADLENTYWKLSEMNGNPVATPDGTREAHLILTPAGDQHHMKGFGGCNSLAGSYSANGSHIKFTVVSTKMMCEPEQMEIETYFTKALNEADRYTIEGDALKLFAGSSLLAVFRAVYFK